MALLKKDMSILPNVEKKLEQYATSLEKFSIYEYEKSQIHWERKANPLELLHYEESPICTTLKVQRDPFSGEIIDFHEVPINSTNLTRPNTMVSSLAHKSIKGGGKYTPFIPGGFSLEDLDIPQHKEMETSELLTTPPGFANGILFDEDGRTVLQDSKKTCTEFETMPEQSNIINLLEIGQREQDLLDTWGNLKNESDESVEENVEKTHYEEENIIPKEPLLLNISKTPLFNTNKTTEWAIMLDATKPVKDFAKKVPEMAYKFSYNLDPFQQLAILQLTQHNNVFVAVPTSAGKTAVALYAIALSQKHLSKAIYTSPIKVLSNQKYRDFKTEFGDVGLITGDYQINEKARCLIMTTEILRSMLFCESDIINDLEYVIFDEVHYINDRERGHVWEQVLILLPKNVCIILLSATVPNPEQFADWLGRTRKEKVYVITDSKRPVPLRHFLFTGTDGKTKNDRYMILNENKWVEKGYFDAKNAIPEQVRRDFERRQFTEKQDKTLWNALISHLTTKNLLPVVAFTFSRAKCDRNARNLSNLDLTSKYDKKKIREFYKKSIETLKEVDRDIPQVQHIGELLSRGVAVHHSGLLPIIREIVEMLFQEGLVKILFATETFAMGVNMPARTVVFDSITKHDGREWRTLHSAEYIQMAGRAGRRGQDTEGTVLILCKNQLPPITTLAEMMKGHLQPLESQFRLTYGMVLRILRAQFLTVEGMMSSSFLEVDHRKQLEVWKTQLQDVEKEIKEFCKEELSGFLEPLIEFFDRSNSYFTYRKEIMFEVFNDPKLQKTMVPGRVLLICWKNQINKLAMLLVKPKQSFSPHKVLVLSEKNLQNCNLDAKTDLWYKMLSLASDKIYVPSETVTSEVIDVNLFDIMEITGTVIKTNVDSIISDWNNRQIIRFKNNPPGQTTVKATQELYELSVSSKNVQGLKKLHFIQDLHVDQYEIRLKLSEMYELKDELMTSSNSTNIPNFIEHFSIVFSKKYLEKKKLELEHKLSHSSLKLYEDYRNRLELLKELEYVKNDVVQLKGNVACGIAMNELLITELITRKILDELQKPAEIAALISPLVFQVKSRNERSEIAEEIPSLTEGIEQLKTLHEQILSLELQKRIRSEDIPEELNFDIVPIVYRWASGESFSDIMGSDAVMAYQEGIIVRCIQQLNDTILDVKKAAKIVGNPNLEKKMEEASLAIKRDIVFAPSLYTQDRIKKPKGNKAASGNDSKSDSESETET